MRSYDDSERPGLLIWTLRALVLIIVSVACLIALVMLYVRWQSTRLDQLNLVEGGHSSLSVVERLYLEAYLASRAGDLDKAKSSPGQRVLFVVSSGESAAEIADNLAEQGLIQDPGLFRSYVRYNGLDLRLEAGTFELDGGLSIIDVAESLTRARAVERELRFLEGWRIEEMADFLSREQAFGIDGELFLALGQRRLPLDLSGFDLLSSIPEGASLEGFLFPDTYRVAEGSTAESLILQMLANMERQLSPRLRQLIGVQNMSIFEAITLASIVEREGILDEERPIIAGVFHNRLAQGMRLEADPTVQYAIGKSDGKWWKSPLSLADLKLDSPYNTYLYNGLPPGPIANPGLASLMAVASPQESDFLFFVADCKSSKPGSHTFSHTYEEHLAKVQNCR